MFAVLIERAATTLRVVEPGQATDIPPEPRALDLGINRLMFEQLDQRSCIAFFASTEEALFLICDVSRRVNYARLRGSPDRKTLEKLYAQVATQNCASGGCPQLPAEAFTADKLGSQLEREAKKFCNEDRNVNFDAATKTVKLSHIFDWYDKDFAKDAAGRIAWITKRRAADRQIPTDTKIVIVDYDWHLNDPSLAR